MSPAEVYVITLKFDTPSFERLQALRVRHFPPPLNFIPAHLTLFHSVSLEQITRLKESWNPEATTPLIVHFTGVRSLGRGTALIAQSHGLDNLRDRMMRNMAGEFSRQDGQTFNPHVTIQNKVELSAAKELLQRLSATFVGWQAEGVGLMIWRYLGGPWSLDTVLPFKP